MFLMGLDIGTTGSKAAVFDPDGRMAACSYQEYKPIYPQKGWMELDPITVTNSIFRCIRECCRQCDGSDIKAIAVSSQGEAIIPVGIDGNPLYNSIITFDSRNVEEHEWFRSNFDKTETMMITGAPRHTMFSITKILWIRNKLPDIYKKTWKFMCYGDYISFKLGAGPFIDHSMASRTMAFDIIKKDWSDKILGICGISRDQLSQPVSPGKVIGRINRNIASRLGISNAAVIVAGGHDQVCCSLGAGVLSSGTAMDSLGTTESILCVNSEAVITPKMIEMNIPCYVYAVNDLYSYLTFLSSSGSVLKWLRDNFLTPKRKEVYSAMDIEAGKRCTNPTGILVLPHFAGSGTPYLDFNSKGVIAGLTLDTDKFQVYKAVLEGTAMEARINIECMEQSGIEVNELRCIGGGSRSDLWLQIKADVTGKKVVSLEVPEAGCLGAAILAGLGMGVFKCAGEAVEKYVKVKKEYTPDANMFNKYEAVFKEYKNLYPMSSRLFSKQ